ncbi:hypothetical protein [Nocardioides montaniterrae]
MNDRAPAWQRVAVTIGCAYELVALWSPLPTITNFAHRRPALAGLLVGALSVHFHPQEVIR